MSKLSKEIENIINHKASVYQSKCDRTLTFVPTSPAAHYQTVATEWAGRAQGLVDTLEWIQMRVPIEPDVDDAISAALAKYKEVGNG